MSNYESAFQTLMFYEGREYEDRECDPGGPTKFGVTIPTMQEYIGEEMKVTSQDIGALTEAAAFHIFNSLWWEKHHYGEIIETEKAVRVLLPSVLFGPERGHKLAQHACNCARAKDDHLLLDGIMGPRTLAAINYSTMAVFIAAMRATVSGYVELKWERKPEDKKNNPGWMPRAMY